MDLQKAVFTYCFGDKADVCSGSLFSLSVDDFLGEG